MQISIFLIPLSPVLAPCGLGHMNSHIPHSLGDAALVRVHKAKSSCYRVKSILFFDLAYRLVAVESEWPKDTDLHTKVTSPNAVSKKM